MTRRRYVWDAETKEFVERIRRPKASISIITDEIPDTYSNATGQWYNSRSALNRDRKATNTIVMDVNEKLPMPEDRSAESIEHDLRTAQRDLTWGNAELTEEERHICKEYNERFRRR